MSAGSVPRFRAFPRWLTLLAVICLSIVAAGLIVGVAVQLSAGPGLVPESLFTAPFRWQGPPPTAG